MNHMKKVSAGERLDNVAQMSGEGLDYAIKKTKDTYLAILDAEGTKLMHEWDREKREMLFGKAIREYLNWANEQAKTGKLESITRDGFN